MSENNGHSASNGFGQSLGGMTWELSEQPFPTITAFVQKLGISETVARIIYNRGVREVDLALQFIDTKLKDLMVDPFMLRDMEKGADRVADAIIQRQNVVIFGDYDVDGATSSALLHRFFKMMGMETSIYIPNRINEGYGPTPAAMGKIHHGMKAQLVITVDCGTLAFDAVDEANSLGMDVIVVDHHLAAANLPHAYAIINPNRLDDDYPEKAMAAVGVSFMLAVAVRAKLRQRGFFSERIEPDLLSLLDLVALGTVCDVMPLRGINRAFVRTGLKIIASRKNVGIATLAALSKIDTTIKAYHLGFVLGPRINAGGRVGEGNLGATLLSTENHLEAMQIGQRLEQLNQERKAIESVILDEAIQSIEEQRLHELQVIVIQGNQWHVGILGIIASRLKERYNRPVAVISINENGMGKGSARSITGIDLGGAIAMAKQSGILIEGGGHPMAGGFVIEGHKIPLLCDFFRTKFGDSVSNLTKVRRLPIDAVIAISAATRSMFDDTEQAGPFGNGNPQPRYAITNIIITKAMVVGVNHLMFIVCDELDQSRGLKCMYFRGADNNIGQYLLGAVGKRVDVAGAIQSSYVNPNKVDFIIEDVAVR